MRNTALIDRALAGAIVGTKVAGVVAAAADAEGTVYEAAFGRRSIDGPARMTTDTVFRIASMTKAITATACMQMVEQGKLGLDQPAGEILPFLKNPQVLLGYDARGNAIMRTAKEDITLRKLLTHTAGFVYDTWNEDMNRFATETGLPAPRSGRLASLEAPLAFDPGQRWEYGINIDVAGRMVEVVSGLDLETYLRRFIFDPLGMPDTGFVLRPAWETRLATVHSRSEAGTLTAIETARPAETPEFFPGGGGLFSTARDYLTFLQALMHGGQYNGARILRPETVSAMGENHMGALDVQPMISAKPSFSNDVELFPGMVKKWGLKVS